MKQILLKNVILFMAVCGLFSCQEYEIGEVPTTKAATETYEGTLYAYLADKDAHPQVTFDSLLFLIDSLPGLKDSLERHVPMTVFAIPDPCFEKALYALNRYRSSYELGDELSLKDFLIEPFTVWDTIINQITTEEFDTIVVARNYDYRRLLDSLVCSYCFDGEYTMQNISEVGGAVEPVALTFGHQMRMEAGRISASGAEELGSRYMRLVETSGSKVTTQWVNAEVETFNLATSNAWVHILSKEHEFGFNNFEQLFYNYGNEKNKVCWYMGIVVVGVLQQSCVDKFVPESLDAFDKDAGFTTTLYRPVLGRNNLISENFSPGNSTQPLTFSITRVVRKDGSEAPELTEEFPVRVWHTPYLGTETSLEEIEAKRGYENRSLLQVREHSGELILWANALSSFVKCAPDSGYVFDIRVTNSGGWKDYTGLRLIPYRERDYEPTNMDETTGIVTEDYVHPTSVSRMYKVGESSLFGLMDPEDINVFFRRDVENESKEYTLTFRFMTKDYQPISPRKFSGTDWGHLVHGFDMEMTDEYVRYKVAYPIPLNDIPTEYTNKDGDKAHVVFRYDRLMNGTQRVASSMSFDFSIYKEGHWEIIFVFSGGDPEFRDNY